VKEAALSRPPENGPTPLARGVMWATQISTLGLEVALPALGGYWLDQRLGTSPILLIVGVCLGFGVSLYSIVKLSKRKP
jgi:F0F1-type ATP synthase assembly protein I